uniref:Uncharacterized protein n=1 Tax=Arundo donax TaxID=35708 RepID=A0A0A8YDA4_ARUDO
MVFLCPLTDGAGAKMGKR